MPDHRRHRGPHPQDRQLFAPENWPRLRGATVDLSWLLTRGYASRSALKIVGDRYNLDARQRVAVARCACGDDARARRQGCQVRPGELQRQELWIDGFNVVTSVESALAHGVILHARDGCYRDLASMHGTYRSVEETLPAIELLGEVLAERHLTSCRWFLDQPVSNSGRLKSALRELAARRHWNWHFDVVPNPDPVLLCAEHVVATADSHVLDRVGRWFNLARHAIDLRVPEAWIVDLSA